jgi:hypothetical protein
MTWPGRRGGRIRRGRPWPCRSRRQATTGTRTKTGKQSLFRPGLPDFSLFNIPKRGEIYQMSTKLPSGHKLYQMTVIYSKWQ